MAEEKWVTGEVHLNLKGNPIEMQMTVPATPVKPQRMLPILQKMTSALVEASAEGRNISCKAGCGACCRQPVPISEMEVYQIAELVESMPEPRRSVIKQRFADGVTHFHEIGWFDRMNRKYDGGRPKESIDDVRDAQKTVVEYFHEGVPCPFLEEESCSIHPDRPLACREYLVTSPAENCKSPSAQNIRMVPLWAKPSKAAKSVGPTGRLQSAGLLVLIRALELAEAVPESFEEKTGERWMADFFSQLTKEEIPEESPNSADPERDKMRTKRRHRRHAAAHR
ncbi:MAG TPA: YkgJ family cysteine cluster protein [Pyrinomonadaceae bacterium]|nr:YkgJ family cysteine cluster protein [Pyrinomonadaceae bacterium]